ncbi:MAG: Smr/MutS family protein [Candidatus Paceibacteria bacterium]
MTNNSSLFSAAEMDDNCPTIDLHSSQSIPEAIDQLERELYFYYDDGAEYCEVIYGGGTGALKKKVLEELEDNPMIEDLKRKCGGSCVVLF